MFSTWATGGAISQEALLWRKTGGIQMQGAAPTAREGAEGEGVLVKAAGEITDVCTALYTLHKTVVDKSDVTGADSVLGGSVLREVYLVGRNGLFIESSEDPTLEVPLDPTVPRNPRRVALRGKSIQEYFFFNWKIPVEDCGGKGILNSLPTLETNQKQNKRRKSKKKKCPSSINKEKVIKQYCEE